MVNEPKHPKIDLGRVPEVSATGDRANTVMRKFDRYPATRYEGKAPGSLVPPGGWFPAGRTVVVWSENFSWFN